MIKELAISKEKLIEIINWEFPEDESQFVKDTIFAKIILNNNVSVIQKIAETVSEKDLRRHAFMVNGKDRNAMETAICNKSKIVQFLMDIESIKSVYNFKEDTDDKAL